MIKPYGDYNVALKYKIISLQFIQLSHLKHLNRNIQIYESLFILSLINSGELEDYCYSRSALCKICEIDTSNIEIPKYEAYTEEKKNNYINVVFSSVIIKFMYSQISTGLIEYFELYDPECENLIKIVSEKENRVYTNVTKLIDLELKIFKNQKKIFLMDEVHSSGNSLNKYSINSYTGSIDIDDLLFIKFKGKEILSMSTLKSLNFHFYMNQPDKWIVIAFSNLARLRNSLFLYTNVKNNKIKFKSSLFINEDLNFESLHENVPSEYKFKKNSIRTDPIPMYLYKRRFYASFLGFRIFLYRVILKLILNSSSSKYLISNLKVDLFKNANGTTHSPHFSIKKKNINLYRTFYKHQNFRKIDQNTTTTTTPPINNNNSNIDNSNNTTINQKEESGHANSPLNNLYQNSTNYYPPDFGKGSYHDTYTPLKDGYKSGEYDERSQTHNNGGYQDSNNTTTDKMDEEKKRSLIFESNYQYNQLKKENYLDTIHHPKRAFNPSEDHYIHPSSSSSSSSPSSSSSHQDYYPPNNSVNLQKKIKMDLDSSKCYHYNNDPYSSQQPKPQINSNGNNVLFSKNDDLLSTKIENSESEPKNNMSINYLNNNSNNNGQPSPPPPPPPQQQPSPLITNYHSNNDHPQYHDSSNDDKNNSSNNINSNNSNDNNNNSNRNTIDFNSIQYNHSDNNNSNNNSSYDDFHSISYTNPIGTTTTTITTNNNSNNNNSHSYDFNTTSYHGNSSGNGCYTINPINYNVNEEMHSKDYSKINSYDPNNYYYRGENYNTLGLFHPETTYDKSYPPTLNGNNDHKGVKETLDNLFLNHHLHRHQHQYKYYINENRYIEMNDCELKEFMNSCIYHQVTFILRNFICKCIDYLLSQYIYFSRISKQIEINQNKKQYYELPVVPAIYQVGIVLLAKYVANYGQDNSENNYLTYSTNIETFNRKLRKEQQQFSDSFNNETIPSSSSSSSSSSPPPPPPPNGQATIPMNTNNNINSWYLTPSKVKDKEYSPSMSYLPPQTPSTFIEEEKKVKEKMEKEKEEYLHTYNICDELLDQLFSIKTKDKKDISLRESLHAFIDTFYDKNLNEKCGGCHSCIHDNHGQCKTKAEFIEVLKLLKYFYHNDMYHPDNCAVYQSTDDMNNHIYTTDTKPTYQFFYEELVRVEMYFKSAERFSVNFKKLIKEANFTLSQNRNFFDMETQFINGFF
ncbi:hypothetical protein BCR36DRAFT_585583 [Piromyces finnis]|uniref:Uncharacterized protein n=1 Tax=Piromyces finnis TaxID=1754191 RepID=A0A1Y1V278_9FUNG|nr:hypothetical protein BCR36DRAFT_585583 [Piromyces finnis]|eukprot:ORX45555.1 hypothetical protein BCR36DRAFT_585583 [Piromyces finnis]